MTSPADSPQPIETYEDGAAFWEVDSASWEVEPLEVAGFPAGTHGSAAAVLIDGRLISPEAARALAAVLQAAAVHADPTRR